MSDLIDRDALMKEFTKFVRRSNNHDYAPVPTWNDAVSLVGSMPSAKQKPKKGQWIVHDYALGRERYECTECGGMCNMKYNYCPNCAAEMFGVAGEKYVIE